METGTIATESATEDHNERSLEGDQQMTGLEAVVECTVRQAIVQREE